MKNLLMILFFAAGFAIAGTNAQTCTPKAAECKMAPCTSACKGSAAAAVNTQPVGVAALASFTPEAISTACVPSNPACKDMKACQAKCTGASASTASLIAPVATQQGCTPAPSCQPKVASVANPTPAPTSKSSKQ